MAVGANGAHHQRLSTGSLRMLPANAAALVRAAIASTSLTGNYGITINEGNAPDKRRVFYRHQLINSAKICYFGFQLFTLGRCARTTQRGAIKRLPIRRGHCDRHIASLPVGQLKLFNHNPVKIELFSELAAPVPRPRLRF